jgi:hypothetical protein
VAVTCNLKQELGKKEEDEKEDEKGCRGEGQS